MKSKSTILCHPAKAILLFLLAILILGQLACSEAGDVKVSLDTKNSYPIITVKNPSGKDVVIKPLSNETGSIGFKINDNVTWIKGKPVAGQAGLDSTLLSWNTDFGTVQLLSTKENGDVNISLSLVNGGKPVRWFLNVKASENEYFTGIFERVVDGHQNNSWAKGIKTALNLRGEKMDMKVKYTVSAYAPFYISSNNYGMFVKGTRQGVYDFCKSEPKTVQIEFEGPDLAFKFYLGNTPAAIVQRHAKETGPSVVPPEWAMGPWRWRDEHFNKSEYYDGTPRKAPFNTDMVEDVLLMDFYDIPCTAQWIDRPWGPGIRGFDDYDFDLKRFPQPEKMIKWLNSKDLELLIWIAPFVMGEMADYAEAHNYYLESNVWRNSHQILMDFTNEEACKWWGENGPGKLAKMGIKGYKLDRADGEKLLDSLNLKTHIGTTYRENFNDYPRQYVKATYDAVKPVLGDDFLLFPRAQFTGSACYGGMWAGDTNGRPEGLRSAIIALQRCAVMGYPVWGSDIGGYWGDFGHETAMRWLGFGCFSPLMEVGPTENRGFWSNKQEPHHDAELIATWRLYSKIRMKLMPYLHALTKEAHETGMPIARPLFLVYPKQKESWSDWQTYLLGSDILVSAIWENGVTKHKLYLPAGENWVDAWNPEKEYAGGKFLEVDAPKHKIPVFIRKGADVDLGDLNALYEESLKLAARKPNLAELEAKEGWQ